MDRPCTDNVKRICQCFFCERKKKRGDCCTINWRYTGEKPCFIGIDEISPVQDCFMFISKKRCLGKWKVG